jgi:ABC-type transporter Mla MlaB component
MREGEMQNDTLLAILQTTRQSQLGEKKCAVDWAE